MTIAFTDGRILDWEDAEAKKIFWHSSAHLMAEGADVGRNNKTITDVCTALLGVTTEDVKVAKMK